MEKTMFLYKYQANQQTRLLQLKMLEELDRICCKHDLRYFADGGTLLGAVREQGFIPWDDDIDIVMLREDYDKLLSLGNDVWAPPFFFQTSDTDVDFFHPHVQIRYLGTCGALENELISVPFNQSIFIDIFPLDIVPSNPIHRLTQTYSVVFWMKLLNVLYAPLTQTKAPKFFLKLVIRKIFHYIPASFLFHRLDYACGKYKGKKGKLSIIVLHPTQCQNKETEWYVESKRLKFEHTTVPVPGEYTCVLTSVFGNWEIPKKGASTHGSVLWSAKENYSSVREKYKVFFNEDQIKKESQLC